MKTKKEIEETLIEVFEKIVGEFPEPVIKKIMDYLYPKITVITNKNLEENMEFLSSLWEKYEFVTKEKLMFTNLPNEIIFVYKKDMNVGIWRTQLLNSNKKLELNYFYTTSPELVTETIESIQVYCKKNKINELSFREKKLEKPFSFGFPQSDDFDCFLESNKINIKKFWNNNYFENRYFICSCDITTLKINPSEELPIDKVNAESNEPKPSTSKQSSSTL